MIRPALVVAAVAALAACQPASDPAETTAPAETEVAASAVPAGAYGETVAEMWSPGLPVTPQEVTALIAAGDARTTVQALAEPADGPNRWMTVIRGVAMGEQQWLDVVNAVSAGTDASTTDDLAIALSDGLTQNPSGVLAVAVAGSGEVAGLCRDNRFETTREQHDAFYGAALESVAAVDDPALVQARDACIAALTAGQANYVAPQ